MSLSFREQAAIASYASQAVEAARQNADPDTFIRAVEPTSAASSGVTVPLRWWLRRSGRTCTGSLKSTYDDGWVAVAK